MHAVVVYLSVRLFVCACVSVTLRYCVKTATRRIRQIMPPDRSGTLVSNGMFCTVVAEFLLTSASRGSSATAESLVTGIFCCFYLSTCMCVCVLHYLWTAVSDTNKILFYSILF